jgi:hypothetical protein
MVCTIFNGHLICTLNFFFENEHVARVLKKCKNKVVMVVGLICIFYVSRDTYGNL